MESLHPHADESDTDNYALTVRLRDSDIVLKQVPVTTSRLGQAHSPGVGDLVLVQFIGGDINAPVITGSLYSDEDRPPVNDDGLAVIHLPQGAEDADAAHIELASKDARELAIRLGEGLTVNLRDDDPAVEIDVGRRQVPREHRPGTALWR